jgi:hypothetical protein
MDYNLAAADPDSLSSSTLQEAQSLANSISQDPLQREVDVGKLRGIEFRELLQDRRSLLAERQKIDVSTIDNFKEQVNNAVYLLTQGILMSDAICSIE